ncbi:MAG: helix-turn-helix domain-containing protein [Rickettsiaceae bacterium]|jgi:putative transcriptional regulator|nr:helix-turn-helix domain-containing protein [Rickettsiaceae bacterium]
MLRLKEILKEKGLTQLYISKAMKLSSVTINQWATGKAMPSVESLIRLCEILEVGLEDLVDYKAKKK